MAVINNFGNSQSEDQEQQQNNINKPVTIGGSMEPTPIAGQSKPSAAPTIQGAPTSSGRFTNLQSYLNANKDFNKDKGGLAGQISSDMSNKASNIQQNFQQDQQKFQQDANAGRNIFNQDNVNTALAAPQAQTQSDVSNFQKMLSGEYAGPQSLNPSQDYASQASQFQSNANLAQTEPGRFSLLKNMFQTPSYNRGQQKLDNLILQSNPEQAQTLGQVQGLATNLNNTIDTGMKDASNLVNQYKTEAQNTQTATKNALTGAFNDFDTAAQGNLDNYNQKIANLQMNLAHGYAPDQETLTRLGLGQLINMPAFGSTGPYQVNPINYIQFNPNANKAAAISTSDLQKLNALSKLAGTSDVAKDIRDYYSNNQLAGSLVNNPYTVDTQGLKNALTNADLAFSNDWSSISSPMFELQNSIPNTKVTVGSSDGWRGLVNLSDIATYDPTTNSIQMKPEYAGLSLPNEAINKINQISDYQARINALEKLQGSKLQLGQWNPTPPNGIGGGMIRGEG